MERGQLRYLYDKNSHPRQERIWFQEEGHVYGVDWKDNGKFTDDAHISASAIISPCFPKFDAALIAGRCAGRGKYDGMSVAEVIQQWEEGGASASEAGTAFHLYAEKLTNLATIRTLDATGAVAQLHTFLDDYKDLEPFLTEPLLFDEKHMLTGSPDILYFSPNHDPTSDILTLQIGDYKNSKAIKRKGHRGARAMGVMGHLADCNFNKYSLQLCVYEKMITDNYAPWTVGGKTYNHIKVDRKFLIVCHDTQHTYEIMDVDELGAEVCYLFAKRRTYLTK
jgi:hypothetical protein